MKNVAPGGVKKELFNRGITEQFLRSNLWILQQGTIGICVTPLRLIVQ
jgi:hypothetical protein